MVKIKLTVYLILLMSCASIALANNNDNVHGDLKDLRDEIATSNDHYSASIDKLVDENLNLIQHQLLPMDPAKLPDLQLRNRGYLTNGTVTKLSILNRTGPCNVTYTKQILHLNISMGWKEIAYNYSYKFRAFVVTRHGKLNGSLHNLTFNLDIFFNFNTHVLTLDTFKITHAGGFDLEVEGSSADRLLSKIGKLIMKLAKSQIIKRIQEVVAGEVKKAIHTINEHIPHKNLPLKLVNFGKLSELSNQVEIEKHLIQWFNQYD